ncbi:hypothetical protein [Burkholderia perseverans]|uniref:hypothetical protein n=1 Tax=Burkholderia perseverans TaxID=2615214 RepID=UPI001FEF5FC5|nr:hypothetical protein [Burkholderia perseverans]
MKRSAIATIAAGLLAGLFAGTAHAGIDQQMRCFHSDDAVIHLEFRTFDDSGSDWSGGYVRYKGAKRVIPIVPSTEHATELVPGRPDEVARVWVEVVDGKVTGQYEMDSQGAIVNDMRYTKFSPRRTYHFVDDPQAYADGNGSCKW